MKFLAVMHTCRPAEPIILTATSQPACAFDMPEHKITSAFAVTDQHGRSVGILVKAAYEQRGPRSVGWHFVVGGRSSAYFYATRLEALDAMGTVWNGYLAASMPASFTTKES